jgi:nicotinamidase-related amidase
MRFYNFGFAFYSWAKYKFSQFTGRIEVPLTILDTIPALLVIDLQKGIVARPTVHPVAEIIGRAARMANAFRSRGLPVVLVNVTGAPPGRTDMRRPQVALPPDWAELVPELHQQPEDIAITKQRAGAFIGTELDRLLRERGVSQVFLTGIASSVGVEATARSAADYGYNVVVVVDAITDMDAEAHRFFVEKIFPRISETESTENVLKILT